jgi:hypothetical protein
MTGIGTTDKSSHVKTAVKISGVCSRFAASIRTRQRRDGTVYTSVLYTRAGKQTSTSFNDHGEALRFQDLCNRLGSAEALKIWGRPPPPRSHCCRQIVTELFRVRLGHSDILTARPLWASDLRCHLSVQQTRAGFCRQEWRRCFWPTSRAPRAAVGDPARRDA